MTRYDAYVLRFWQSTGKDGPQWKGRIEHLGRGESVQFDNLEALLHHIRTIAGVERGLGSMDRGPGHGEAGKSMAP